MNNLSKIILIGLSALVGFSQLAIAAMTAAQTQAFQTANSGGASVTPAEVNTLFSGLVGAVVFLWFCWVLMSAYKGWAANKSAGTDAMWQILRALLVLIITIVVVS